MTERDGSRSTPDGSARRAALGLLSALLLSSCHAPAPNNGRYFTVGVYAIWLDGASDEDREDVDLFLQCLIHGSTLNHYWGGRAGLEYRGSFGVDPPDAQIDYREAEDWLREISARGRVPRDDRDDASVWVVFASGLNIYLRGACGRSALHDIDGEEVGVGFVGNHPLCWPTRDRLRTETQVGLHELVEATDRVLGHAGCAGDGACEGRRACGEHHCDTFVGLSCEGAPEASWTGCRGGQVEGWVIQKLASAGRRPENCERCMECDFTPRACPPEDPSCAAVPAVVEGTSYQPRLARRSPLGASGLLGLALGLAGLGALGGWLWRRRR